jgi:hypothetical protein
MDKNYKEVKMTEEKNENFVVLQDLPQVPTRVVQDQEGKEYQITTYGEALKEILEIVRELKKGITG